MKFPILSVVLFDSFTTFISCKVNCEANSRHYLVLCVKVSHLLAALQDPVLELQREDSRWTSGYPERGDRCKYAERRLPEPEGGRSPLCRTLRQLLLPLDAVDSKTWIVPLALAAAPRLESLGDCLAHEGLRLAADLGLESHLPRPTSLEEISLSLEDFGAARVRDKATRRLKSLLSHHAHWSIFSGQVAAASPAFGGFSLKTWVEEELGEPLEPGDVAGIKERWRRQIEEVARLCPRLRSIRLSVQPSVLCLADKEAVWGPLAQLEHLSELHIHSSGWPDAFALLVVVGSNVKKLSLRLDSPTSTGEDDVLLSTSFGFVNTVPYLCPGLRELCLGYLQGGETPHSLSPEPRYDLASSYADLVAFEATGNVTLEALQFLWQRASMLETLRITGSIVTACTGGHGEVVLTKERVEHLFSLGALRRLRELDVNLTLSSIPAAQALLERLPERDDGSVATLTVKVSIPESLEGENFGDLVSSVLARMASFKAECQGRRGRVAWNWRREGILTILLQQQTMLSFSDLIDP